MTVAIFAIGGAIGAFAASIVSRRFGRRGGLLRANLLGIIAATCMCEFAMCLVDED